MSYKPFAYLATVKSPKIWFCDLDL